MCSFHPHPRRGKHGAFDRITLKKDVPVVFELTTADVLMGFSIPDFSVRADILPGKLARVRLVPDKVGTFTFPCESLAASATRQ